ncbi:sulfur carrier protein ThiS [Streptomyces sp. CAU 1734]|uniref:sulfur carrier protein ThiS n=1 Tax=Streptomyces sp. CAU 1734 TaxID=3140360 RepID=UPI003261A108
MKVMNVVVNGVPRLVPLGCTTAQIADELRLPVTGVAVAVDGEVVPRGRWDRALREGAAVEVLTAVQGG